MKHLTWMLLLTGGIATAQDSVKPAPDKNELKYNLNASGTHFFKATFLNQTWVRFNQSNPGTTVINEPASQTLDLGLRRTRMQLFGQISDRAFVYFQLGMNNFNFLNGFPALGNAQGVPTNRKVSFFIHDAVVEYSAFANKDWLKIGGGLTILNGLSRFSQPSVTSIMSMDVPVFAQATVDQTDEFSRKLTIYARGQVGKWDYRIGLTDPFPITTNGAAVPAISANASFAAKGHHKQYQGFLVYNLFDKDTHQTPYMTGTYLGKKKILNLEGGFISQKKAMWNTANQGKDTVYNAMNLWSLALFADMPINKTKGTAFSGYLGYFHTDYGPNYLRFNGIMNPASGTTQGLSGVSGVQGNAFPMFGTGSVVYSQLGYLCAADLLGKNGTLMPYATAQVANYQRLSKTASIYSVGVNWLIKGHNSKITLDYQNRPVYQNATDGRLSPNGRRSALTLQYQIFI